MVDSTWGLHVIWLPLSSVWKTVWFICSPKLIGKDLDLHNFLQAAIFMVVSSSNWQVSDDIWWMFSSLRLSWCFAIVLSHSFWPQHSQTRAFSAEIICTILMTNSKLGCKGTFYSEKAVEMSNRHIKVPKIVLGPLFPVRNIISSNMMIISIFFHVNKINVVKATMNMY